MPCKEGFVASFHLFLTVTYYFSLDRKITSSVTDYSLRLQSTFFALRFPSCSYEANSRIIGTFD
jgi:hypothetical protein